MAMEAMGGADAARGTPARGVQRTLLLPTGTVLNYLEWGEPACPSLLLLHDFGSNKHAWDSVASKLSTRFRVLVPDLRGHGETKAPNGDYRMQSIVDDLLELAVRLDLNGRNWDCTTYTRPWLICGRGLGGAVAAAFAASHGARLTGISAIDYDPAWAVDQLCSLSNIGAGLMGTVGMLSVSQGASCLGEFIQGMNHGCDSATKNLTAAAERCAVLLLHTAADATGNADPVPAARAAALVDSLEGGGALSVTAVALPSAAAERCSVSTTDVAITTSLGTFATAAEEISRDPKPAKAIAAAKVAAKAAAAVVKTPVLSDEMAALQDSGGDLVKLKALAKGDKGALHLQLKSLGFKGMRQRAQLEKQLVETLLYAAQLKAR